MPISNVCSKNVFFYKFLLIYLKIIKLCFIKFCILTFRVKPWQWSDLNNITQRCPVRKCVLRNFAKFTGKNKCFPVNFTKLLRTPFSQNTSGDCFCNMKWVSLYWKFSVTWILTSAQKVAKAAARRSSVKKVFLKIS